MIDKLDRYIHKTQYGFRKCHSTIQSIYIARRITDYAEEGRDNVVMVLLDWEKAFDKIDQGDFEGIPPFNNLSSLQTCL